VNLVGASDNLLGAVPLDRTSLNPGDIATGIRSYQVTEADLPGPLVNTAIVTATLPGGGLLNPSTSAIVTLQISPSIAVAKVASTDEVTMGQSIVYTYHITNTGDVSLHDITAVDDKLGNITLNRTRLAPGEAARGISSYMVPLINFPGPIVNVVEVAAMPPVGEAVASSGAYTCNVVAPFVFLPLIHRNN
jgi:hypothetical protein